MPISISAGDSIRPVLAAVRAVPRPALGAPEKPDEPARPFITISREVGAGGWTLAQRLADALNAGGRAQPAWSTWDRELVEKVAADHKLSRDVIETLEERDHSWLSDLIAGMGSGDLGGSEEAKVYGRVAATIRAIAKAGHAVICGRGGVFVTRHMPRGIHIRLVAPLEHRIAYMASTMGLTHESAGREVATRERNRQAFFRRHWPAESLGGDAFTVTYNTAAVSSDAIAESVLCIVRAASR